MFLYRVIITASRRSCKSFPSAQEQTKNSWSLILSDGPPFSHISGGTCYQFLQLSASLAGLGSHTILFSLAVVGCGQSRIVGLCGRR